jgi:AAA domain
VDHLSLCYIVTLLPEGTGKSFVGALCAKILLLYSSPANNTKILVNCYTNHALDQFLEDLIKIGIPKDEIVRFGSRPNQNTAELSLQSLSRSAGYRMTPYDWEIVETLREQRERLSKSLHRAHCLATAQHKQIMQHLAAHHKEYAAAFRVPESTDGAKIVGKGGRAIKPNYLLDRWLKGQDAGSFKNEPHIRASGDIWKMERAARLSQSETWRRAVVKKGIDEMLKIGKKYNECVTELESLYRQGDASVLRGRRIIGCTTTGAAMYRLDLCSIGFPLY